MTSITIHLLVGIAIALADYYYSTHKCQKRFGGSYLRSTLEAIEHVLDNSSGPSGKSSTYSDSMLKVKEYLIAKGLIKNDVGLMARIKIALRSVSCKELVNSLSLPALFATAAVIEILFDLVIGVHIASPENTGLISILIADLYQIPLLFIGLVIGRILKDLWQFTLDNGENQKMEDAIKACIENTHLLDTVLASNDDSFGDDVQHSAKLFKVKLTRSGEKFYKKLTDISDKVTNTAKDLTESARNVTEDLVNYQKTQQEKHEKDKEERKSRFDDITKGR